jgi:hypothetical protein
MGRIYTISYTGTLTAAGTDSDLFTILPADDKACRLRGLILAQTSEVADAAEEILRISLIRLPATVTNGSGGSSVTPNPIDSHAAAVGFSARGNDTTVATTSGSALTLEESAWNIRISPLERWWPDNYLAPIVYQGEALVVRCQSTAADDITIAITAYVEED